MKPRTTPARALARRMGRGVDERLQLSGLLRREASHVFPKHHSFLWGEIALYSFIVLIVSGVYLSLFFVPDTTEVDYQGQYDNLRGLHTSRAFQSVLNLSFEVRGGLFIRQMHHWAAHIFIGSIALHMFRNFFTGAFRKPRELTWLTGVGLLMLSLLEGYLGYSMLDDLLSGLGVRIIAGLLLSVPVIGTWLHWLLFGSEFQGDIWISRFFVGHVLLLPGVLAALVSVHLLLVWYQKHSHFRGPGARETNVVGDRAAPGFTARTLANGLAVVGVLALLGAIFQINPVFLWGPYTPSDSSTGAQPDWYIGFLIGALRLFPPWDINLGPFTVPAPFWPGIALPAVMFLLAAIYPFLEQLVNRDRRRHHILQRPRDNPTRTAIGAMAMTFYLVLLGAGGDDVIATAFTIPYEWLVWGGRVGVFVLPVAAYVVTHRVCRGLQRADREVLERGLRTGLLRETEDGVYAEVRQPLGGTDHAGRPLPLDYDGARIDRRVVVREDDDSAR